MYCLTSQLERDLKDKLNKPLLFLIISLLELLAIDLKLCNTLNSLKKSYKPLFPAIYLPKTSIIESK